jgi:hypothetical protein
LSSLSLQGWLVIAFVSGYIVLLIYTPMPFLAAISFLYIVFRIHNSPCLPGILIQASRAFESFR